MTQRTATGAEAEPPTTAISLSPSRGEVGRTQPTSRPARRKSPARQVDKQSVPAPSFSFHTTTITRKFSGTNGITMISEPQAEVEQRASRFR